MPRRIAKKVNGRALAGALVGAVFALFGVLGYAYNESQGRIDKNAQAAREAQQTARRALLAVKALCAQRDDLDTRVKRERRRLRRSRKFLRDNPHGIAGIPEALIRAAVNDDAATYVASKRTRKNLGLLGRCQFPTTEEVP